MFYIWNVTQHQSIKHRTQKEEVDDHPLPMRNVKKPMDWDLMEDSIDVLKIYKLLQRLKDK